METSAEESAVELAIKTVDAKIRRWEETLENGLLSLKECASRIKELRGQREDLLSRKAVLQKQTGGRAKVLDGSIYRGGTATAPREKD
jgi:hypothetical protein